MKILQSTLFMETPDDSVADIFQPGGRLRFDLLTETAAESLRESIRLAKETRWESLRSPHVFMGLLAQPDAAILAWGERLGTELTVILDQFQELFHQEKGAKNPTLALNREFLSDNVIRLLRDAYFRSQDNGRHRITPMDLLISLLTAENSIVVDCFQRIGWTAAKLTELAVLAEHQAKVR